MSWAVAMVQLYYRAPFVSLRFKYMRDGMWNRLEISCYNRKNHSRSLGICWFSGITIDISDLLYFLKYGTCLRTGIRIVGNV